MPRAFRNQEWIISHLKGELTALEQCHLRPPLGFRTRDHRGVAYVWRLKSPLYRQGDTGRAWYRTLHAQLVKQGFARIHKNPCLYAKKIHSWILNALCKHGLCRPRALASGVLCSISQSASRNKEHGNKERGGHYSIK